MVWLIVISFITALLFVCEWFPVAARCVEFRSRGTCAVINFASGIQCAHSPNLSECFSWLTMSFLNVTIKLVRVVVSPFPWNPLHYRHNQSFSPHAFLGKGEIKDGVPCSLYTLVYHCGCLSFTTSLILQVVRGV